MESLNKLASMLWRPVGRAYFALRGRRVRVELLDKIDHRTARGIDRGRRADNR